MSEEQNIKKGLNPLLIWILGAAIGELWFFLSTTDCCGRFTGSFLVMWFLPLLILQGGAIFSKSKPLNRNKVNWAIGIGTFLTMVYMYNEYNL